MLCDYARRMPFVAWHPPEAALMELRQVACRLQSLTVERTRERGRLHATQASQHSSAIVTNDIEVNLRHLDRRIKELVR